MRGAVRGQSLASRVGFPETTDRRIGSFTVPFFHGTFPSLLMLSGRRGHAMCNGNPWSEPWSAACQHFARECAGHVGPDDDSCRGTNLKRDF